MLLMLAAVAVSSASATVAASSRPPMNPAVPRKAPSNFEEAIDRADQAVRAKDWPGVYQALRPLLNTDELAAQTGERRHAILLMFATAALVTNHADEALAQIKIASTMPQAEGHTWFIRMYAAAVLDDGAEALASLARLADLSPDEARALPHDMVLGIHELVSRMDKPSEALAQFDGILFRLGWQSDSALSEPDFLWTEYAGILLDRGDVAGARTVVARVSSPEQIIEMRADRRFDPVVRRGDPAFDPRRAALAQLAKLTQAAKASPDKLEPLLGQVGEMRRLGQFDAAQALIEAAIARVKAKGDKAYADFEDQSNWLYDIQARLLMDAGRVDEALAIQARGAQVQENGDDNTSQVLNLGDQYVSLGRPKEALAAIAKVGGMSGYGQMVRLYVEGCAQAQLGNTAKVQANIAEMRKLWPVNADALQDLLVCSGDLDGAAQVLIRRLADPQERTDTLADLQDFHDRGFTPPFAKVMGERLETILARPDVQAAIAEVGRIETYDLWPRDT
ncbi:tetratricopeptide (TPR) repeat protein [Caulobacter ginsengisoli]|uniref:Tetratricopeptide (TPR) repeat protein n=2 Tax=Caulobacter ginsengisoli TaxID=400775 RepID=A0ABU0IYM7_9CAUL|nr:tetratricopeptide (TPR) repeat protein [Caulobacter ginsengisoli]